MREREEKVAFQMISEKVQESADDNPVICKGHAIHIAQVHVVKSAHKDDQAV